MSTNTVLPAFSRKQAVVIGGGIAGLLTAQVLHDYFEHVTIVERDHYPADPLFRPGTPQARHVHILLVRGQRILEAFFPGIQEKLLARGAIAGDFIADYAYYNPAAGWTPRFPSPLKFYACSRPLLEWQVRQEVLANARVQIIEGREVVGLLATSNAKTVIGVTLRMRGTQKSSQEELERLDADFVVDTSGRDSHAPQWLQTLNYEPLTETTINPGFGYASRLYEPPNAYEHDWKGLIVTAAPPQYLRGGVIWPHEDGNWMVILGGTGGDYPPTDEEGFLDFARSLPEEKFFNAIKDARPLSPISGYRRTENRLRHFERLTRFPEGFVVLGDAVCSFNPVYGQGMTVAALSAELLGRCLQATKGKGLIGIPQNFQRQLAHLNTLPWELAAASDYRSPIIKAPKASLLSTLMHRYFDSIISAMPSSPTTTFYFTQVLHLLKPPATLFHPTIILTLLKRSFSQRLQKSSLRQKDGEIAERE